MMPRQIPGGKAIQHETSLDGTYRLNDRTPALIRQRLAQEVAGQYWHQLAVLRR